MKKMLRILWGQYLAAVVGLWIMASPTVLKYGDTAEANDYIFGPLVTTFAVIAWWQATRAVRWVNLPIGIWFVFAPFVLGYAQATPILNSVLCGIAVAALSFTGKETTLSFGGGWRSLWPLKKMRPGEESFYGPRADWFH